MFKPARTFGIAAVFCLAMAGSAFAHAHLKTANPAVGGTVALAPSELDLTFTEGVNLKFTGVKVTGPNKAIVKIGQASLKNGDLTLVVPISQTLHTGVYSVAWHALSTDGHKTKGTYKFTVKP